MNEFAEHLLEHLDEDAHAVVVVQKGSLDAPDGWALESTTYCNGKRVRTFKLPEAE